MQSQEHLLGLHSSLKAVAGLQGVKGLLLLLLRGPDRHPRLEFTL